MNKAQARTKTSTIKPDKKPKPVAGKASDTFVKCLESEGVTHIFGVPGEENADFMMSLLPRGVGATQPPAEMISGGRATRIHQSATGS